jgi:hypothetical protein
LRSEKAAEHPDLRQFDWQKPRKLSEIDVCLFRVFATLESPQKIALWLTGFGFTVSELTDHINHSAIPDEIDPTKGIDAAADQAIYRRLRPSLLARVLGLDTARAFTIGIRFNDDLKLLHVSSGVVVE